ncbi:MAG: hypothetical protein OEV08_13070 [Nitrospira sp.]|nr:hypothetical protein [Nitrospira sp.]
MTTWNADTITGGIDNGTRSERGANTLGFYRLNEGNMDDGDQTTLTDLLTDLMHVAASSADAEDETDRMDFDRALAMARIHFDEEMEGA